MAHSCTAYLSHPPLPPNLHLLLFPLSLRARVHADYAEYYSRYYTFYYSTVYSEKFAESTIQRGIDASGGRAGLAARGDADAVAAHTVLAGGV